MCPTRKLRSAAPVVLALLTVATQVASSQELPRQLTIRGHQLVLNGEAVRSELLGMLELYRIGLYLKTQTSKTSLVSADVAKALRLQILEDTRSNRLPESWREELQPTLVWAEIQTLRAAYARLREGDTLTISYVPAQGSRVTVNGDTVLQSDDSELMHAFLDQWLGQDPVSEEIKAALLNRSR